MAVHERFKDRPVIPEMKQGLTMIYDLLGELCPDETAAFKQYFPDMRDNMERSRLPAVAGLTKHKKYKAEWTLLVSHGHVSTTMHAAASALIRDIKTKFSGEDVDVEVWQLKLSACIALEEQLRPALLDIDNSKSADVQRAMDHTNSVLSRGLRRRAKQIHGLDYQSMTAEAFGAFLEELENEAASLENEASGSLT